MRPVAASSATSSPWQHDDVGLVLVEIVDDAIAGSFDHRPEHVLHPRIPARHAANRLLRRIARAGPTWLANSQCASTSSAGSPLIERHRR